MILENTLAVGPVLRWLGLAMSMLFIFSVLFVYAGSALWQRLQQAAIKRELNKMQWHKLVPAILLSFALLNSQMAYGQPQTPRKQSTPEIRAEQYQKLFLTVNGFLAQVQKQCKTEACTQAATDGLALIADAQEKQKNGMLSEHEPNRKEFHAKLRDVLYRAHAALVDDVQKNKVPISKLSNHRYGRVVPANYPDPVMCAECQDTFATLADICSLYMIVSPEAALICFAAATIGFARCVEDWCSPAYKDG